ncbi:hypothetical protein J3R82DRAFT_7084 [Butyriboletus roseoflavus]|nr:hypothetical protein J3R82DRAFT_7084 [Butyriboletus roseoflavus]
MADAGFFKGTSADQDRRFSDKELKLLKTMKFPPEFDKKVDMKKVNLQVIKPWIAKKVTELVGLEDEVVVEYAMGLLEDPNHTTPDPKKMQINLNGFLTSSTPAFMTALWSLLLEAQDSPAGVPKTFVEEKKEEMRKARESDQRAFGERDRRARLDDIRENERADRGGRGRGRSRGRGRGGFDGGGRGRDSGWGRRGGGGSDGVCSIVTVVGFPRAPHHLNAIAPRLDHHSMLAVLAHPHHLPIGLPAHPPAGVHHVHPRDIVHHRPVALDLDLPLLNVHVVVTVVRPLLPDAANLLPSLLLEAVLGLSHCHLLPLEGANVPHRALAPPQEDTVVERTDAVLVGALRYADVVFPDLRHHLQVVHLRPYLGMVGAVAQVLEAVARVGAIAHLALVHHHHRVAEILGNVIGL